MSAVILCAVCCFLYNDRLYNEQSEEVVGDAHSDQFAEESRVDQATQESTGGSMDEPLIDNKSVMAVCKGDTL